MKTIIRTVILISLCLLFSCSSFADPKVALVRKMYDSLSKGDTNGYMDTILPENRTNQNPLGLFNALSLSLSYGPVGVNISDLTSFSISDLKVKTLSSTNDNAVVQAEGNLRYPLLTIEMYFCDTHDLRKVNGQWYVDVYAPEKQARVEQLLAAKQGAIMNSFAGVSEDDLAGMISAYMNTIQQAADLCDH